MNTDTAELEIRRKFAQDHTIMECAVAWEIDYVSAHAYLTRHDLSHTCARKGRPPKERR